MGRHNMLLKYANRRIAAGGKRVPTTKKERKEIKTNVRYLFRGIVMAIGVVLIVCGVFRRQHPETTKQTHLATEVTTMGRRLVTQKNSSDTSLPYECQQIPELAGLKDYLEKCTGYTVQVV